MLYDKKPHNIPICPKRRKSRPAKIKQNAELQDDSMAENARTPLHILIIHDSMVIKNILQEYILTDHPDARIDFCREAESIVPMLNETPYNVVFCGMEMKGADGYGVKSCMTDSEPNSRTPLIVMTATDTPEYRQMLADRGIDYVLPLPCTSIQFREVIYRVFNPQSNIVHTLYAIPESRALIYCREQEIPAEILNISRDSIVCGLQWEKDELLSALIDAERAVVLFPADYGKASTIGISGDLLGIKEHKTIMDQDIRRLRMTWRICWNHFELQAATKRPLRLRLDSEFDPLPEISATGPEAELEKENLALKTELDSLASEKEHLVHRILRLQERITDLEKISEMMAGMRASGRMINETPRRSDNPVKLSIFKRLIEENMKIRNQMSEL
jgi:CheY-like chemotaxis protein